MTLQKHSRLRFRMVLGIGALVATVLSVQCVRTYLYTCKVLVPQQAEREAERQAGALTAAAHSAGITDARGLGPAIGHALDAAGERVLWMRVLDPDSNVLAQGGDVQGTAKIPARWWERVEAHTNLGAVTDTPQGKALVAMFPFRMPRPPRPQETAPRRADFPAPPPGPPPGRRAGAYVIELAIPLKAVAGSFEGLRQNLIVGMIASIALLLSLAVIGLCTPHYLRGRYLESEMQLARRVQNHLQPKAQPISPHVDFGASAVAADHVGGDFYDVFEADSGRIGIVLGDVSGKGMPAALLGSVLQGAIRSSMTAQHQRACERINRMFCERTAGERFATLFWGVFDPATRILRYVNAGHVPPMLVRQGRIERLEDGGPVLGLLPAAAYCAGTVEIEDSDMLVLYSDGISEAADSSGAEFGEGGIEAMLGDAAEAAPGGVCARIMNKVAAFANGGMPQDDRTLVVVRFPETAAAARCATPERIGETVAA